MTTIHPPAQKGAQAPALSAVRSKYLRYVALAEAEVAKGDRVAAENFYQHAEHCYRSMANTH